MKHYINTNGELFGIDKGQEFLIQSDWVELTQEEVEAIINPPKTPEEVKAEIEQAIQKMLDDKAKELRYDNMMSARSYAGFVNQFQTEAQTLAAWCAACWTKAGELEALGAPMTVDEVLAQMPVYGA